MKKLRFAEDWVRSEVVATISRTTSTQTQMKSQLEKPHNTTRQTEGHNTSHKYAPSYENQVWLSQWPPLLSCCPKPDWENKIPVVLFIRLFVSGGRRRARDRDRVWGSYVTAGLPTPVTQTPPMSSTGLGIICYELRKVELIQRLSIAKTVCRILK